MNKRTRRKLTYLLAGGIFLWKMINPINVSQNVPQAEIQARTMSVSKTEYAAPSSDTEISPENNPSDLEKKFKEAQKEAFSNKLFDEYMNKYDWVYKNISAIYSARKIPDDSYINKKFVRALIKIENTTEYPYAVSPAGARGLAQVMRDAWNTVEKKLSYDKYAFNSYVSLDVGIRYLLWIDGECRKYYFGWKKLDNAQKRKIISASYNGGIYNLFQKNWNVERMKPETKDYVVRIPRKMREYENLQEKLLERGGYDL